MTFILTSDDGPLTDDDGETINYDTRAEAEDKKAELSGLFSGLEVEQKGVEEVDPEVIDMSTDGGNNTDNDDELPGVDVCSRCGAEIENGHCPDCDDDANGLAEPVQESEQPADQLPDEKPGVDTDPLSWVPSDFVDTIEGQPAINRKGFEVICQHYGVSVKSEMVESPSESGWTSCIHKATAVTEDGVEYTAYGSAHVDRGDDKPLLIEMSDTRSYKRAASRATGVGMLAVEELQAATVGGEQ